LHLHWSPLWSALILFSLRIYQDPIKEDEYSADPFSAKLIQKEYGCDAPSRIARDALDSIVCGLKSGSLIYRIRHLLLGGLHPTNEERVRRIMEEVDDNLRAFGGNGG
jgi:Zn-dependent protease with chaperone function